MSYRSRLLRQAHHILAGQVGSLAELDELIVLAVAEEVPEDEAQLAKGLRDAQASSMPIDGQPDDQDRGYLARVQASLTVVALTLIADIETGMGLPWGVEDREALTRAVHAQVALQLAVLHRLGPSLTLNGGPAPLAA